MRYPVKFELELKKHNYPGSLIAIEGIDGSGKTTQAQLLVEELKKTHKKVIYTKEPTDGEIGKLIRTVLSGELKVPPVSLQYLFCADRAVHQEEFTKQLKEGYIIVTDRYFWSAVAYGMADLNGSPDFYLTAFSILSFYNQFFAPDYTLFLDVKIDEAVKRLSKSKKHTEIYDKRNKLVAIDKSYKKLIKKFEKEFIIINGNSTEEKVLNSLVSKINI